MLKKYTHLFFDLDNTLWDFDSNSFDALKEALQKTGLFDKIGSYDEYYKIFESVNDKLWALYRDDKLSKRELRVQRFEESFEKNGTPFPDMANRINDAYIAEIPYYTRLIKGAGELLDYLYGKYEMAVITNGSKIIQVKKIDQSGLAKYFKKIFTSDEIGVPKPKREIFDYALMSMNARKKNSLMIGDSWEADIIGAMQYGIDQIFYSPGNNVTESDPVNGYDLKKINSSVQPMSKHSITKKTSTIIISSFSELFEIL